MVNHRHGSFVAALMEGAGMLVLALVGSKLMFAAELQGAGITATLVPALVIAVATVAYRAGAAQGPGPLA